MSDTDCCACNETCPSAPDITVNENTITIEDADAQIIQEDVSGTLATDEVTLTYTPVSDGSLKMFVNGVLTIDWTRSGKTVTFGSAPVGGSVIVAAYFSTGA